MQHELEQVSALLTQASQVLEAQLDEAVCERLTNAAAILEGLVALYTSEVEPETQTVVTMVMEPEREVMRPRAMAVGA